MNNGKRHLSLQERSSYQRLEDVVGCKWSTAVIAAIDEGVERPGELERYIPGISKKVLSERLRKLLAFGLLTRSETAGTVPRVDYRLTPLGKRLSIILRELKELQPSAPAARR
ncbi:MAG TPA: helix-turn-helix domain-containing protein [Opitutus sp.]|nr:helix-turn-helix domain-containing protein [Opitutus sp.]